MTAEFIAERLKNSLGNFCIEFAEHKLAALYAGALVILRPQGFCVVECDIEDISDERKLLNVLNDVLPSEYDIHNWGILDDALKDGIWLRDSPAGLILYLNNSSRIWINNPELAGNLINSFQPIASKWALQRKTALIVFQL